MRTLFLPFIVWVGLLQLPPANQHPVSLVATATLLSAASALAGLTILVYRLGVWRAELSNTRHNIAAEIARYREDFAREFAKLDRHFEVSTEQQIRSERSHGHATATLGAHERQIGQVETRVTRLEQDRAP